MSFCPRTCNVELHMEHGHASKALINSSPIASLGDGVLSDVTIFILCQLLDIFGGPRHCYPLYQCLNFASLMP